MERFEPAANDVAALGEGGGADAFLTLGMASELAKAALPRHIEGTELWPRG